MNANLNSTCKCAKNHKEQSDKYETRYTVPRSAAETSLPQSWSVVCTVGTVHMVHRTGHDNSPRTVKSDTRKNLSAP
jgi:hypothetical protein